MICYAICFGVTFGIFFLLSDDRARVMRCSQQQLKLEFKVARLHIVFVCGGWVDGDGLAVCVCVCLFVLKKTIEGEWYAKQKQSDKTRQRPMGETSSHHHSETNRFHKNILQ